MKKIIIGFAGKAGVGKDTAASICNYIFSVGITRAKYDEWYQHRSKYDYSVNGKIFHFGDTLKDVLSAMYNIDRCMFDDRKHKDELYYDIKDKRFVTPKQVGLKHMIIDNNKLLFNNFNDLIVNALSIGFTPVFKLRTLMQYFATDICRKQLYSNIWIDATMGKARSKLAFSDYALIADCRFQDEVDAIKRSSCKTLTVNIVRPRGQQVEEHVSEIQKLECDYTIDNDSTLLSYFYKIQQLIQDIVLQ